MRSWQVLEGGRDSWRECLLHDGTQMGMTCSTKETPACTAGAAMRCHREGVVKMKGPSDASRDVGSAFDIAPCGYSRFTRFLDPGYSLSEVGIINSTYPAFPKEAPLTTWGNWRGQLLLAKFSQGKWRGNNPDNFDLNIYFHWNCLHHSLHSGWWVKVWRVFIYAINALYSFLCGSWDRSKPKELSTGYSYAKYTPEASASTGSSLEMQNLKIALDLANDNLHFNKICKWSASTVMPEDSVMGNSLSLPTETSVCSPLIGAGKTF